MEASEGEGAGEEEKEEEGAAALMSEDEGVLLTGPGEAALAAGAGAAGGEAAVKGSPEYQAGMRMPCLALPLLLGRQCPARCLKLCPSPACSLTPCLPMYLLNLLRACPAFLPLQRWHTSASQCR